MGNIKFYLKIIAPITAISIMLTSCSMNSNTSSLPISETEYLNQRESIVSSNLYKTGSTLSLNDKEKALDNRLKTLIKTYEDYTDDTTYAPANPFYDFLKGTGTNYIANTPLYKLIRDMPKGGNLHVHTTATFGTENFLNFLHTQDNIYVCPKDIHTSDGTDIPEGSIRIFKSGEEIIEGFVPLKTAIEEGMTSEERLLSLWTIDEADEDIGHIWDEFNDIFSRVGYTHGVDKELFKEFYHEAFSEQIKDNVSHIELRTGITEFDGDKTGKVAIEILRDVYYDLKKEYPDFTLKLIIAANKGIKKDPASVKDNVENMIYLKENIKDEFDPNNIVEFIVGFDLVGAEDDGHQLIEYSKYINEMRKDGKEFDLYFHAGESVLPDSQNMVDAYLLGSKRIGHGLNLYRFPDLMEKIKEKQIALEVCPISNQLLRYCYDLRTHPAVEYLKRDVPFTICSDDPLAFNTTGLSYDFFEAIAGWHLGIAQIKQLCINSIKYSAASDSEKNKMMSNWEKEWNEFVENNYQVQDSDNQKWY